MVDRENLVLRTNEYTYSFKHFRTINTFGRYMYNGKTTLKEAHEDRNSSLVYSKKKDPQNQEKIQKKKIFLKITCTFCR